MFVNKKILLYFTEIAIIKNNRGDFKLEGDVRG